MAERKMTPKGFLHKTTTKAAHSAAAFLAAHREWLRTGELSKVTDPILRKLDMGELLPTPALKLIQQATLNHIIESDRQKTVANIEEAGKPVTRKPWMAAIMDAQGHIVEVDGDDGPEPLAKGFEHPQEADRWADRRLFDGASDWYAVIEGLGTRVVIQRQDAIARILKRPKGPAVHQKGTSTKTLGFGVRAKQDRASFSRG